MHDPTTIADTYLATWNETDPERRAALLRERWTEGARYADPLATSTGRAAIAAMIDAVQARFPGFRFARLGNADGHGEHVRFSWSLGPAGAEPPIKGTDVVVLADGRIDRVIGFLDQVPAGAVG